MSSIPNAKMKHAHANDAGDAAAPADAPAAKQAKASPTLSERASGVGERARDLAEDAIDAVKARPKTAAIVAGAAAVIGGPAAARALRGDDKADTAADGKKKPAKKKG